MKIHTVADLFPMMNADEYKELVEDISVNGLKEPIWTYDNQIIDGRNRYKACVELVIEPKFRSLSGSKTLTELIDFVVSLNLKRRHLSSSQKAVVSLEIEKILSTEKERERRDKISYYRQTGETTPTLGESNQIRNESARQAAKVVGVSHGYVSDAKKIADKAPEILEKVKQGAISIESAKEIVNMPQEKRSSVFDKINAGQKHTDAIREVKKEIQLEKKPKPTIGAVFPVIYHASADDMPIDNETIDLIITSPPYNLGSDTWNMGGDNRAKRSGIGYDDDKDEEEYQKWQITCLNEMWRVSRFGASLFYNHKVRSDDGVIIHPMDWLRKTDWLIRQECIWDRKSTHNHNPKYFYPEDERIYWLTKGSPNLPDRSINQSSVWRDFGPIPNQSEHPAPFSDVIPERCIQAVGFDGMTVLDPFMGSGTTLRVALKYGYNAIGVEINEDYIKLAESENGWTTQ